MYGIKKRQWTLLLLKKGYYDRSLKKIIKLKKNAISLGIAYSFQKSQKIPTNKHDFKLDYIFTENGIINSN